MRAGKKRLFTNAARYTQRFHLVPCAAAQPCSTKFHESLSEKMPRFADQRITSARKESKSKSGRMQRAFNSCAISSQPIRSCGTKISESDRKAGPTKLTPQRDRASGE